MRAFVVGTAGHVDHGKTELVRALTGVDTDRWDEEKERGLTIDLGFAPLLRDEDLEVGLVDVPGHEDFVKNMMAGATGVDLLLLVVAADEGPMPQTREHLTIARLLGVTNGVVALSKVDRVGEDWLDLVREAVAEELRTVLGHDRWPMLPVSSTEGEGVERIRQEIRERARALQEERPADLFRMPVDRSFTVRGAGTVVTGTTWSGEVSVEDRVRLLPADSWHRVRSLQVHGEDRDRVGAGRRCALALAGLDPGDAPRGSVVVSDDSWRPVRGLGARVRLPPYVSRRLEEEQRVRVYLGTREVMARIGLRGDVLEPGEEGWIRLRLEAPLVARVRDRFVLRFYSPVTTLGGGRVAELEPPADWAGRIPAWRELLESGTEGTLRALTGLRGGEGVAVAEVPLATGLPLGAVRELEAAPPEGLLLEAGRWYAADLEAEARRVLREELEDLQRRHRRVRAVSLEALRSAAGSSFGDGLLERALRSLEDSGEIVVDGPRVRSRDHEPTLTGEELELKEELVEVLREGGLEPPEVKDLASSLGIGEELLHDLLTLLEEEGSIEAVSRELYVVGEVAERVRRDARSLLEREGKADAGEFKDMLGVTRKYLIPFLEYLDEEKITRRTPEGRVLREDGEA